MAEHQVHGIQLNFECYTDCKPPGHGSVTDHKCVIIIIDAHITISILEYIVIRLNIIFHIHALYIASSSIRALFIILYLSFNVHNFDTLLV